MEEKHYIEWIEAITDNDRVYRQFLSPGKAPEAVFNIDEKKITAREYCNEAFQEPGELYGYSAKALCRGEKSARASLTAEKAFDRVILTDERFTGVPIKDFNCWRTNGNNIEKRT